MKRNLRLDKTESYTTKVFNPDTCQCDIQVTVYRLWEEDKKGGFVESLDNIEAEGWVADNAIVAGNVTIAGHTTVKDQAFVYGKGRILAYDDVVIAGGAYIVAGKESRIDIYNSAKIQGHAKIFGTDEQHMVICDASIIHEHALLYGDAGAWSTVVNKKEAIIGGDAIISNTNLVGLHITKGVFQSTGDACDKEEELFEHCYFGNDIQRLNELPKTDVDFIDQVFKTFYGQSFKSYFGLGISELDDDRELL